MKDFGILEVFEKILKRMIKIFRLRESTRFKNEERTDRRIQTDV